MNHLKRNQSNRRVKSRWNSRLTGPLGLLVLFALLAAACTSPAAPTPIPPTAAPAPTSAPTPEAAVSPSVTVEDQEVVAGTVTIAEVVSEGPGWLVVHAQAEGKPGPVLGYSPVADGQNVDVAVELDLTNASETLYAMLHSDAGEIGSYEFPGPDAPVQQGEAIVMTPFKLNVAEGAIAVNMVNFGFDPAYVVVRAGTTVTWNNQDGVGHTATDDHGDWDSGLFGQGGSYSYTFEQPGVYPYYCAPHGGPGGRGMAGTIVVLP